MNIGKLIKKSRNRFNKCYRKKKKEYYETNLKKNRTDGRKTWGILNDLLGRTKSEGDRRNVLVDGEYKEGKEAADALNNYFIDSIKNLNGNDLVNTTLENTVVNPIIEECRD